MKILHSKNDVKFKFGKGVLTASRSHDSGAPIDSYPANRDTKLKFSV